MQQITASLKTGAVTTGLEHAKQDRITAPDPELPTAGRPTHSTMQYIFGSNAEVGPCIMTRVSPGWRLITAALY